MHSQLRNILNQNFYFCEEGGSMYVFESHDRQYILKLFKTPQAVVSKYASWGIHLGQTSWRDVSVSGDDLATAKNLLHKQRECIDYIASHRKLQHAVVYHHDGSSEHSGHRYKEIKVDIPTMLGAFILQFKVLILDTALSNLGVESKSKAQNIYMDVAQAVANEWEDGIFNITMNIHHNYGYHNGVMVGIDLGDYLRKETSTKEELVKAMENFTSATTKDIRKQHPACAESYEMYLSNNMQKVLCNL